MDFYKHVVDSVKGKGVMNKKMDDGNGGTIKFGALRGE